MAWVAVVVLITPAGTKRVLQIIEDMRWCTVHLTENNGKVATKKEDDLAEIENEVVAATYDEYIAICGDNNPQIKE